TLYNVAGGLGWIWLMLFTGAFLNRYIPGVEHHTGTVIIAVIALSFLPAVISWLRHRGGRDGTQADVELKRGTTPGLSWSELENAHGSHVAPAVVRTERARAAHRCAHDGDPPRQASSGVRHEPEHGARESTGPAEPTAGTTAREARRRPRGNLHCRS